MFLPVSNSLADLNLSNVNIIIKSDLWCGYGYGLGLGIDATNGYDESIAKLTSDGQDLTSVSRVNNLKQSIALRLLTRHGTLYTQTMVLI